MLVDGKRNAVDCLEPLGTSRKESDSMVSCPKLDNEVLYLDDTLF
jgi:hypothetical protein